MPISQMRDEDLAIGPHNSTPLRSVCVQAPLGIQREGERAFLEKVALAQGPLRGQDSPVRGPGASEQSGGICLSRGPGHRLIGLVLRAESNLAFKALRVLPSWPFWCEFRSLPSPCALQRELALKDSLHIRQREFYLVSFSLFFF